MLRLELVNAKGVAIVSFGSEGFTRGMATTPLLPRAIKESFTEAGVEVTPHREALVKAFCNILATGAQFDKCTVEEDGGTDTIVFTAAY